MPVYEFQCPKCKTVVELQKKITDDTAPLCCEEDCNIEMDKIISKNSFALKGKGWFKSGGY